MQGKFILTAQNNNSTIVTGTGGQRFTVAIHLTDAEPWAVVPAKVTFEGGGPVDLILGNTVVVSSTRVTVELANSTSIRGTFEV